MPHSNQPGVLATGMWLNTRRPASLGINIPTSERASYAGVPRYADMLAMSQAAVGAGFEVLWFDDHFSFTTDTDLRGAWDAWTLMAAIAATVPEVYLGPMVACTAYRNPGVIAKMSEMIDEISCGRFILGLGAGWHKPEYDQFGIRYEPRVSQFEEALEIIHSLVRTGKADVQGTYYQANEAVNLPRGPRPKGPPILIGSTGERMLKSLVRYADAWNTGIGTEEELKVKIAKLDAACEDAGRDPRTVVRTIGVSMAGDGNTKDAANVVAGNTEQKVDRLREIVDLGFQHIMITVDPSTPQNVAAAAPVVRAFYAS